MSKISKKIYLDYAATTPVDKEVLKEMLPYFKDNFGNPSSIHFFGQKAITAMDQAREKIAKLLNCDFSEIIFTGSATEANNLAIKGFIQNYNYTTSRRSSETGINKFHIISTNIEHESVHEPLKELKKEGYQITYLPVNKDGFIKISDLENSINDNTSLISIIYANNEIGIIQPIKEIGKLLEKINDKRKERGLNRIYFHTDAVQAFQFLECRPDWLKVDSLTFSGHKIYGPKGIGALYVRRGTPLAPIIYGGGQEFWLRSGTENVAGIVGLAKAVEFVFKNREARFKKILNLRNQLLNYIIKENKDAKLNGSLNNRLPNNLNIRFPGINNETFLIALDQQGLSVSAGSACSARASKASYVLTALGLTEKQAKESIRITLGKDTTASEIKKTAKIINKTIDGKKYSAKVLARDPVQDLAVLKIDVEELKTLTLADSDNINDAITKGKIMTPYLGVRYLTVTSALQGEKKLPFDYGALVSKGSNGEAAIVSDSPASNAGIKEGDIILEFGSKKVDKEHQLASLIVLYPVGEKISLKIWRDGKIITLQVILAEKP